MVGRPGHACWRPIARSGKPAYADSTETELINTWLVLCAFFDHLKENIII